MQWKEKKKREVKGTGEVNGFHAHSEESCCQREGRSRQDMGQTDKRLKEKVDEKMRATVAQLYHYCESTLRHPSLMRPCTLVLSAPC